MKIVTLIEGITRRAGWVGAVLSFPLIGALVYEVFSRYMLGRPTPWAFEISYMAMGAIFMFGMANALRVGQHVSVDVLSDFMGRKVSALVKIIGYLIFLPITSWLVVELSDYTLSAFESSERSGRSAWNPIVWPAYATWLSGFFFLALQTIAEIIKSLDEFFYSEPSEGSEYE